MKMIRERAVSKSKKEQHACQLILQRADNDDCEEEIFGTTQLAKKLSPVSMQWMIFIHLQSFAML